MKRYTLYQRFDEIFLALKADVGRAGKKAVRQTRNAVYHWLNRVIDARIAGALGVFGCCFR